MKKVRGSCLRDGDARILRAETGENKEKSRISSGDGYASAPCSRSHDPRGNEKMPYFQAATVRESLFYFSRGFGGLTSHTSAVLSALPEISVRPSAENASEVIVPRCPGQRASC
jgi:hypothetical protein